MKWVALTISLVSWVIWCNTFNLSAAFLTGWFLGEYLKLK